MIIKNAAFIFDLLTNKLSRSKAFEKSECSKKTNSNSRAGLVQSRTVIGIELVMSHYFFISSFFLLIKEKNNSHQSSLLIGPNVFLNSSN